VKKHRPSKEDTFQGVREEIAQLTQEGETTRGGAKSWVRDPGKQEPGPGIIVKKGRARRKTFFIKKWQRGVSTDWGRTPVQDLLFLGASGQDLVICTMTEKWADQSKRERRKGSGDVGGDTGSSVGLAGKKPSKTSF